MMKAMKAKSGGETGPAFSKQLGLSGLALGYICSAFGWSYVIAQIPGGWLLDRFGDWSS